MNSEGLHLKSYFAASIEGALESGRRELGPDALLMSSRLAPPEARNRGQYEVVLAAAPFQAPAGDGVPRAPDSEDRLLAGMSKLSVQLKQVAGILNQSSQAAVPGCLAPQLATFAGELRAAGISDEYVAELTDAVLYRLGGELTIPAYGRPARPSFAPESVRAALVSELDERLKVDPALGLGAEAGRVAAFVGPNGGGKTTSIVKLAVKYGLQLRQRVHLVSTDIWRIGGSDHLRACAAILGVPFQVVSTTLALNQFLDECRGRGLVLIDTPGFSPSDMTHAEDIGHLFARRTDVDVHLVVPASMRGRDLANCAKRAEVYRPAKLLFTRMDETDNYGAVLGEALRSGKALSFFGTGPLIPEDVEEARKDRVLSSLTSEQPAEACTAA